MHLHDTPRPFRAAPPTAAASTWRTQVRLFVAAYLVCDLAPWLLIGSPDRAQEHARWIINLERTTGLAIERSVQGALGAVRRRAATLAWLYRRPRHVYRRLATPITGADRRSLDQDVVAVVMARWATPPTPPPR